MKLNSWLKQTILGVASFSKQSVFTNNNNNTVLESIFTCLLALYTGSTTGYLHCTLTYLDPVTSRSVRVMQFCSNRRSVQRVYAYDKHELCIYFICASASDILVLNLHYIALIALHTYLPLSLHLVTSRSVRVMQCCSYRRSLCRVYAYGKHELCIYFICASASDILVLNPKIK